MQVLYSFFLMTYWTAIRISSLFNDKAVEWIRGRKNWKSNLRSMMGSGNLPVIWMHCASLGEFEQGRPVFQALRNKYPQHRFLLTFFSPSGYLNRKNEPLADWVSYLPLDGKNAAVDFVEIVRPVLAIFVKYEFWHYYSLELSKKGIPLYCISAIFRPSQLFFKWYGKFYLNILKRYEHIFVQDRDSLDLLKSKGLTHVSVAGDTRFDRVKENALRKFENSVVNSFCENRKVLVAGSTWPEDDDLILNLTRSMPELYVIIVPHEISTHGIGKLISKFEGVAITFSQVENNIVALNGFRVLVIDSIGMLSSLYRFGSYAYLGGGFGTGIHNTLEAAVYGKPVFFGPNFARFREAVELIGLGAAFSVKDEKDIVLKLEEWSAKDAAYNKACRSASEYVDENAGATGRILQLISSSDKA